jgi:thioesterase domain-containing protein
MLARAQALTGQAIPLSVLFQNPTIAHLASLARHPTAAHAWSPIVGLHEQGTRPPFFCVHPIGGVVLCYRELAEHLGPDQPFYAIQARGLEAGQTPHISIKAMAADYLEALQAIQKVGPYRLGGWSLGGVVAFEMARQLDQQGQEVAALILLDSWAPIMRPAPLALEPVDVVRAFIRDIAGQAGQTLLIPPASGIQHDVDALLTDLLERAHALSLWPADIDLPQVQRMLAVYAANLQAVAHYQPQPYPGRLTLLRAGANSDAIADSTLGWSRLVDDVECYVMSGDHFSMLRAPGVEVLAERMRICLDRTGEPPASTPACIEQSAQRLALQQHLC